MTNKLKGFLVGFSILFLIAIINNSQKSSWERLNLLEKVTHPFFMGVVGGVVGFLIGSGVREKK
jgi:hypothetical protein